MNDKGGRSRIDLRKFSNHRADLTLVKENRKFLRCDSLGQPNRVLQNKDVLLEEKLGRNCQSLVLLLCSVMDRAT